MEIKCNSQILFWNKLGALHTLIITSASITEPNQEIKAFVGNIVGKHNPKIDQDVEAIYFHNTEVYYMPRGIGKIFPNLKAIEVNNCGLKEITREDLGGMEKIEKLVLEYNKLTSLPDNLFEGMKNLKRVSFGNNKLEFVSSKLLQPVLENQLTFVDFRNNPAIDAAFNASQANVTDGFLNLSDLMKLIEDCKKPPEVEPSTSGKSLEMFKDDFLSGFNDFWTSGEFSDFTIIVGDRNFPVHKCVLAMQSNVFNEFLKNAEANPVAELMIKNFSAEVVEEVLRWMYTGKVPGVKNALEVFALVMKLKISGLKEIAENLILKQLNQENAMEVFELGQRYKSENLKNSAFNFAFDEIKKFFKEENLDEKLKEQPEKLKKLFEIQKNSYENMKKALED